MEFRCESKRARGEKDKIGFGPCWSFLFLWLVVTTTAVIADSKTSRQLGETDASWKGEVSLKNEPDWVNRMASGDIGDGTGRKGNILVNLDPGPKSPLELLQEKTFEEKQRIKRWIIGTGILSLVLIGVGIWTLYLFRKYERTEVWTLKKKLVKRTGELWKMTMAFNNLSDDYEEIIKKEKTGALVKRRWKKRGKNKHGKGLKKYRKMKGKLERLLGKYGTTTEDLKTCKIDLSMATKENENLANQQNLLKEKIQVLVKGLENSRLFFQTERQKQESAALETAKYITERNVLRKEVIELWAWIEKYEKADPEQSKKTDMAKRNGNLKLVQTKEKAGISTEVDSSTHERQSRNGFLSAFRNLGKNFRKTKKDSEVKVSSELTSGKEKVKKVVEKKRSPVVGTSPLQASMKSLPSKEVNALTEQQHQNCGSCFSFRSMFKKRNERPRKVKKLEISLVEGSFRVMGGYNFEGSSAIGVGTKLEGSVGVGTGIGIGPGGDSTINELGQTSDPRDPQRPPVLHGEAEM